MIINVFKTHMDNLLKILQLYCITTISCYYSSTVRLLGNNSKRWVKIKCYLIFSMWYRHICASLKCMIPQRGKNSENE